MNAKKQVFTKKCIHEREYHLYEKYMDLQTNINTLVDERTNVLKMAISQILGFAPSHKTLFFSKTYIVDALKFLSHRTLPIIIQ